MVDDRAARIAEFIKPLRVRPGRKVPLSKEERRTRFLNRIHVPERNPYRATHGGNGSVDHRGSGKHARKAMV
jgi:hypothetical protein